MNRPVVALASSVIGMLGAGGLATLSFLTDRSPACLRAIESQVPAQIEQWCGQMTSIDFVPIVLFGALIFVVIEFRQEVIELPNKILKPTSDRE